MPCKRYYDAVKNGQPENNLCPVDACPCMHLKPNYAWHLCTKVNGARSDDELAKELELLKEQRETGAWKMNVFEHDEFEREKKKRFGINNGAINKEVDSL